MVSSTRLCCSVRAEQEWEEKGREGKREKREQEKVVLQHCGNSWSVEKREFSFSFFVPDVQ